MSKSKLHNAYRRGRLSGAAARTGFLSANRCGMYYITIKKWGVENRQHKIAVFKEREES